MWTCHPAIAVNGRLVPTASMTVRVLDPFSLANLGGEDMVVDVLELGSMSKLRWIVGRTRGVVQGHKNWWASNTKAIPLLCEMKDTIKKGRRLLRRGAHAKSDFVFVKVRGATLLVGNKTNAVTLALTGNAGMDAGSFEDKAIILVWILTELEKDIRKLQPEEYVKMDKAVKLALGVLRASSEVRWASWRRSSNAFRVAKMKQKTMKDFKVPSPKKGTTQKAALNKTVADTLRWAEL